MDPRLHHGGALPRIVYIAGYGRCGSTILDIVLGAHRHAASCGELTYLLEDFDAARRCACKRPYSRCEVWAPSLAVIDPVASAGALRRAEARPWPALPVRIPRLDHSLLASYATTMRQLLARAAAGMGAQVLIDSSKTTKTCALRPIRLAQSGFDVRVIHLHRGFAATMRSVARRSNWAAEGRSTSRLRVLRALPGYWLAHRYARLARRALGPANYLPLDYEQLIAAPVATIRRLGDFIGLDYAEVAARIAAGDSFAVQHNVGGNRIRLAGSVSLLADPAAGGTARGGSGAAVPAGIGPG
jgi:hypothetical protein